MKYKLWIPDESMGILKHIENLGGSHVRMTANIYEIHGISARKLAEFRGIFVIDKPRTMIEKEYLRAIQERYRYA